MDVQTAIRKYAEKSFFTKCLNINRTLSPHCFLLLDMTSYEAFFPFKKKKNTMIYITNYV